MFQINSIKAGSISRKILQFKFPQYLIKSPDMYSLCRIQHCWYWINNQLYNKLIAERRNYLKLLIAICKVQRHFGFLDILLNSSSITRSKIIIIIKISWLFGYHIVSLWTIIIREALIYDKMDVFLASWDAIEATWVSESVSQWHCWTDLTDVTLVSEDTYWRLW